MIKDKSRDVVKQALKKLQRRKHTSGLGGEVSKPVTELLVTETSAEKHVWGEIVCPGFDLDLSVSR